MSETKITNRWKILWLMAKIAVLVLVKGDLTATIKNQEEE